MVSVASQILRGFRAGIDCILHHAYQFLSHLSVIAASTVDQAYEVLRAVAFVRRNEVFERTSQIISLQVVVDIRLVNGMLRAGQKLQHREKLNKVQLHSCSPSWRAFLSVRICLDEYMTNYVTVAVPERLFRHRHRLRNLFEAQSEELGCLLEDKRCQ